MKPVTIGSVRAHGVRELLVYCLGKREGDWPCHHQGALPIDRLRTQSRQWKKTHLMSLSGVKRTSFGHLHMSAFDPKRTPADKSCPQTHQM
jgi:hypothetical protein